MIASAAPLIDTPEILREIAVRLVAALLVGAAIGFERSYRGRPAGFRTHALVCLSTSLLMLLTAFEQLWVPDNEAVKLTLDPTRMAQGIMTGIGFLGSGAILRDGLTVCGLTTAASIWITAAIGIMVGIGFYIPALIAAVLTPGTLSVFGWLETHLPAQIYARFTVRFARSAQVPEEELRQLVSARGFTIANLSYHYDSRSQFTEYSMVIRSTQKQHMRQLSEELGARKDVLSFQISPTGD